MTKNNIPKILIFAGSTRIESFNKKLVKVAANIATEAEAEVTFIDLKFYPMPLYDGDLEQEIILPEHAVKIRQMMQAHDGFMIAAPEYNSSISGVLKNVIDWASRPQHNEKPLICFKDKVVALMSASPGRLGGLRGLAAVRSILTNIGCVVIPNQVAIPHAHEKFTEDGYLKNEAEEKMIENLVYEFIDIVSKLK